MEPFIAKENFVHQPWYNESHMVEGKNVSHYHKVELEDAHMNQCYLKVDMMSKLSDSTDYVYTEEESILGGLGATIEAIAGSILNFLVIAALTKNTHLRKQYMTPSIVSLATTDLLFSLITLPMLSHHYFSQ